MVSPRHDNVPGIKTFSRNTLQQPKEKAGRLKQLYFF
jgi:hypothetical protein